MVGSFPGSTRQTPPRRLRPLGAAAIAALLASHAGAARADTRLDAHYTIKVAHISIGKSEVLVSIGDTAFTGAASGQASGMMRFVVRGEGAMRTTGAVVDGKLVPASFALGTTRDKDHDTVKMALDGGNVKDLSTETNVPDEDRVPVTEADRKGIVDPLTAMLIRMEGTGDMVAADACNRTLPIFDGRRRFDLALSFKRIDQVKADKGYAGPAVVCAVALHAIAGHRPGSPLFKYLTGGRDIELTFAPVSGTRLLAPFGLAINSMLGNLVIEATDFTVATAQAAATAPTASATK
jgi:hypothetical protein